MANFNRDEWLDPDRYQWTQPELDSVVKNNHVTDMRWWNIWTANMDRAMETCPLPPFVDSIYGKSKGACIVAGAGPSLERNMDEVRRISGMNVPIIAVDRAFPMLKENGLKPEMTVTIDAQLDVLAFFTGRGADDVLVASPVSVMAGDADYLCGNINPFSPFWNMAYQRYGKEMACARAGIVVTFTTIDIALWRGFNPILLIGNEHCYDSEEALKADSPESKTQKLPDGRVTTDTFLRSSRGFQFFKAFHPEIAIFDGSNGISPFKKVDMKNVTMN